jgi:phytanoyl-CoA hydroxylase
MTVDVRSNQGPVVPAQWLRQTPKDTPLKEMRRRLREDGYVYVKNLLPREDVQKVREEYVSKIDLDSIIGKLILSRLGILNYMSRPG